MHSNFLDRPFFFELCESEWVGSAVRELDSLLSSNSNTTRFPPTDTFLEKSTGNLVYRLAIAGYDPKDVSVKTDSNFVQVEGKKTEKEENLELLDKGIKASSFNTKYPVASKYNLSAIKATFKNGILELTIPISEERKPKDIKIEY